MAWKYLRRVSDSTVVDSFYADPWATPASWQNLVDALTHDVVDEPTSGGSPVPHRGDLLSQGAPKWKIVSGSWVARTSGEMDSDKRTAAQQYRQNALIPNCVAIKTADPSLTQAMDDKIAELQAKINANDLADPGDFPE